MNYDEFTERLKQEIQSHFEQQLTFVEDVVNKTNELLESLTIRFEDQMTAPTIYPQKLYADYQEGIPFSKIADSISASLMMERPQIPELTIENAQKSISFSLLNKEKNKQLLKDCPYKEVHDMAAILRWHISDEASFVVNNNMMQHLRLTKEELLDIAQKNTESADYSCKSINEILKDTMIEDGVPEEFADDIDDMFPIDQTPFHVISNQNKFDGSCAVLSDSFMQKVSEQIGNRELYLLPSSRHEMLVVNPDTVFEPEELKNIVMDINSNPNVIKAEDFLSDSIYKYNANTHSLLMCDSKGLFHDKGFQKENIKQTIGRGRD